jgi:hypothetical protein
METQPTCYLTASGAVRGGHLVEKVILRSLVLPAPPLPLSQTVWAWHRTVFLPRYFSKIVVHATRIHA